MVAILAICPAACATAERSPDQATTADATTPINPARIDRVRTALPAGYEFADLRGPVGPITAWGYRAPWSTDPTACAALADPTAGATSSDGWSASGPGGIVYAVVATAPKAGEPAAMDECARWSVSGGRTTGTVTLEPAPEIAGASTVAMSTASTTVVEGGTETHSHADTVTAYTGDHVAFVAVVTDPGSPNPQLGSDFAADLMVKTVSALRG